MKNKIAFVFPGQGSQSVGMLSDVAEQYPVVRNVFEQASDVIGFDLWKLVCDGPLEDLNKTVNTQPAMLAADIAMWSVWKDSGNQMPSLLAGHSLGEYAALVAAQSISFTDCVILVRKRAEYMCQAVDGIQTAMAAILSLDNRVVVDLCKQATDELKGKVVVEAANFNSPGQVVVAGNASAVDKTIELAKLAGAKRAKIIPVSVPSHCSLMIPAAEKLSEYLKNVTIKEPSINIINNVDAKIEIEPEKIRDSLVRQVRFPVQWVKIIEAIVDDHGVETVIECGPGKVLTGLNKRINRDLKLLSLNCSPGMLAL